MKALQGAVRLSGFDKPTVWTIMTPLAIKTESANLVQSASIEGSRIPIMAAPQLLS